MATRLEIAQGKVQATRKQPGANARARASTAPPPSSPAAQRKSRHQPPDPNTASTASTARSSTTRSTVSKGNTGASEGTATHSAVAESNAPPPVNTGGTRSAVSKGNTGASEGTACWRTNKVQISQSHMCIGNESQEGCTEKSALEK